MRRAEMTQPPAPSWWPRSTRTRGRLVDAGGLREAAPALITRIGRRRITRSGTHDAVRVPPAGGPLRAKVAPDRRVAATKPAGPGPGAAKETGGRTPEMGAPALIARIGRRRITRCGTNLAQTRQSPRLARRGLTRQAGMTGRAGSSSQSGAGASRPSSSPGCPWMARPRVRAWPRQAGAVGGRAGRLKPRVRLRYCKRNSSRRRDTTMTGRVEGKVAFITGAARGQGRSYAGPGGRGHHRGRHRQAGRQRAVPRHASALPAAEGGRRMSGSFPGAAWSGGRRRV
jgi:hypothetical protein